MSETQAGAVERALDAWEAEVRDDCQTWGTTLEAHLPRVAAHLAAARRELAELRGERAITPEMVGALRLADEILAIKERQRAAYDDHWNPPVWRECEGRLARRAPELARALRAALASGQSAPSLQKVQLSTGAVPSAQGNHPETRVSAENETGVGAIADQPEGREVERRTDTCPLCSGARFVEASQGGKLGCWMCNPLGDPTR